MAKQDSGKGAFRVRVERQIVTPTSLSRSRRHLFASAVTSRVRSAQEGSRRSGLRVSDQICPCSSLHSAICRCYSFALKAFKVWILASKIFGFARSLFLERVHRCQGVSLCLCHCSRVKSTIYLSLCKSWWLRGYRRVNGWNRVSEVKVGDTITDVWVGHFLGSGVVPFSVVRCCWSGDFCDL